MNGQRVPLSDLNRRPRELPVHHGHQRLLARARHIHLAHLHLHIYISQHIKLANILFRCFTQIDQKTWKLCHAYYEGVFDNGGRGRWLTCCQDEEDDGRGGGHCGHHRDTPARHSWQYGNLAGFLRDDISYNEVVIYTPSWMR